MIILTQLIFFAVNLSYNTKELTEYQYNIRTIHQRLTRDLNRAIHKDDVFINRLGQLEIQYQDGDSIKYYHNVNTRSIIRNSSHGIYPISENITNFNYTITPCKSYLEVEVVWNRKKEFAFILKIPQREI
ncbi:hypothetical protein PRVXT_000939 [Proteinivorax tanatarense]|uniref:Uncharacterized protein n=1 Tax=Proteinivorax tanatarense TaxID=1260629 RepID=A0AAU7VNY0_9FIRM